MEVESVRRKTCLHRCNIPSTCLGIQEFFVSFCCLFWGLVRATQSNFPTRWSVDYHQRTSHTVFFVFRLQYAKLVEKVQIIPVHPSPESAGIGIFSRLLSISFYTPVLVLWHHGKVGPRHPDTRLIVSTCTSGQQGPFSTNFNTIMTPKNWTLLLASVTSRLKLSQSSQ